MEPVKRITLIGTCHDFQTVGNPWEKEFREMLRSVIENLEIQIILEEWNDSKGVSIAITLKSDKLQWENVGTQDMPEFDTSKSGYINFDPDGPHHIMFRRYVLAQPEMEGQRSPLV